MILTMPLGLRMRTWLAFFTGRTRARPAPVQSALEACAPGVDEETVARVNPKGRQAPAPFEISTVDAPEGTYVQPTPDG